MANRKPLPTEGWVTIQEAAAHAGVHENTVRRWIDLDVLRATRAIKSGSSPWRVDVASLRRLLRGADEEENR